MAEYEPFASTSSVRVYIYLYPGRHGKVVGIEIQALAQSEYIYIYIRVDTEGRWYQDSIYIYIRVDTERSLVSR